LSKDEVSAEDVREAYKLMMAAREEDVPAPAQAPIDAGDDAPDGGDDGDDDMGPAPGPSRGLKRPRAAAGPGLEDEAISTPRLNVLMTVVAGVFNRQRTQQLQKADLLEGVNAALEEGERNFEEEEFEAGLTVMEVKNKILLAEDEVLLVA